MKISAKRLALLPLFYILYEFSGNMSNDMYLPAFLQITQDLETSHHIVQFTISCWLLGMSLAQVVLGPLSDRFGRRPVLFYGGLLFLFVTVTCALSPNIWVFAVARIFQGFGVGSIMIAGYASIHELYDHKRATLILAWTSSAAVLSPLIGPLLGSYILLLGNWRDIFWVIFLVALFALVVLLLLIPESLKKEARQSLQLSAIMRTYGRIFRSRKFLLYTFSFGFLYGGMILWITASPIIIMKIYGHTPTEFGYLQIPVFAGFILGAQCVRFFLRVLTREQLVTCGVLISLVGGVAMLLLTWPFENYLISVLAPMIIFALGFGLSAAPLTKETLMASEEGMGMVTGVFFFLMSGIGMGISLLIAVLQDTPRPIAIALFIIGVFSYLLFMFRRVGDAKKDFK